MNLENEYSNRRLFLQLRFWIIRLYGYKEFKSSNTAMNLLIEQVIERTYNVKINDLRVKCRLRKIVEPRQIWATLLHSMNTMTLEKIGVEIGNKDHATVLHCVKTVKNLYQNDKEYQTRINRILSELKIPKEKMNF